MSNNKFFTRFNPAPTVGLKCTGGRTQSHFKDECDINRILKLYKATGIPPPQARPVYLDLIHAPRDLSEAYEYQSKVVDWFDSLPSDVRQAFENDPLRALKLVNEDLPAAIEKGLIPRSDAPTVDSIHSQAAAAATPEPLKEAAEPPTGGVEPPPTPPKA